MPPKRKKIVKVDDNEEFDVLDIGDLQEDQIEEVTIPPLDSGMEADEEKELHLKNIIEKKCGKIPIPSIREIKDYTKTAYEVNEKYYKYHKDVENTYVYDDIDTKLMRMYNLDWNTYAGIVSEYKKEIDSNKRSNLDCKLSNYEDTNDGNYVNNFVCNTSREDCTDNSGNFVEIKNKIIDEIRQKFLIREENTTHLSYVCFRKRILKLNRKNRRSESHTHEKLSKVSNEFNIIREMTELLQQYNQVEAEINNIDLDIAGTVNNLLSKNQKLRNQIKTILNDKKSSRYRKNIQEDVWNNATTNREKIRTIRRRLKQLQSVDEKEVEEELCAFKNYLKSERLREWRARNL